MAVIKRFLPKSEFGKNVSILFMGTAIAQAIPILLSVVLSRLYTPSDFGLLAIFQSFVMLLAVIITGRYEMAIVVDKEKENAVQLWHLSILISVVIALVVTAFFGIKKIFSISIPSLDPIDSFWFFIPILLLAFGFFQSTNYWFNRNKAFKEISIARIIKNLSNNLLAVLVGWIGFGAKGLIFGFIAGNIVSAIYLFLKSNYADYLKQFSWQEIKKVAKIHENFPKYNLPHSFVNIGKENGVNLLIAAQYSQDILGQYFLMLRILKLPVSLVGGALAQVFFKEASDKYAKDGDVRTLVKNLVKKLVIIGVIPALFIILFSKLLFVFVFGQSWDVAGGFAQALVGYIFFHFIASPLGMVPIVTHNQKKALFWGTLESVLFFSIFFIGFYFFQDLTKTLYLLSAVMSAYFIIYFRWIYSISKAPE